jgi:hypothetical protein
VKYLPLNVKQPINQSQMERKRRIKSDSAKRIYDKNNYKEEIIIYN